MLNENQGAPVSRKVVLFDGVCNLCDSAVQFLIRRDHKESLKFASLQSATGSAMLAAHGLATDLTTFVYISNNKAYTRSDAWIKVLGDLGGAWQLVKILLLIPKPLRDGVYNGISRSRYRIFGKKDVCMIPTPALKQRFLA